MTTERIDIEIQDKVSPGISAKIMAIAEAARSAERTITSLKRSLKGADMSVLEQVSKVTANNVKAEAQLINSKARLLTAQNRQAESAARTAVQQEKLKTATMQTANASDKAAISAIKLWDAQTKSARGTQAATSSMQAQINALTGVTQKTTATKASFQEAARGADSLRASVRGILAAADPLGAELRNLTQQQEALNAAQRAGVVAQDEYNRGMAFLTQRMVENRTAAARLASDGQVISRTSRQGIQQTQNLIYQLNDVVVSLASGQRPLTVMLQQGSQIATVFGPGKGVLGTFRLVAKEVGILAVGLAPWIAGITAIGVAFRLLQNDINDTSKVHVSFMDTVRGTFQTLADYTKDAFGDAFADAATAFAESLDKVINWIKDKLNNIIFLFKRAFWELTSDDSGFGRMSQQLDKKVFTWIAKQTGDARDAAAAAALPDGSGPLGKPPVMQDYLGEFANDVSVHAVKNALAGVKDEANGAAAAVGSLQESLDDLARDVEGNAAARDMNEMDKAVFSVQQRVEALTLQYEPLNSAQREMVELIKETARQSAAFAELDKLVEETATPVEKVNKEMARLRVLQRDALSPQYAEALRRKMSELGDSVNANAQIFKDFASDIGKAFSEMFEGLFNRSIKSFKDVANSFYQIFTKMLARLATVALAQPVILPIVSAAASGLGLPASVTQAVGKELGLSDVASSAGTLSNLSSGMNTSLLPAGGFIDRLFISPENMLTANLPSSGFTPGAGLAGLAGSFAASALFGGGIGTSIGSGVGGIAGSLAAGALGATGVGLLAAPFLGSLLGGGLGSLFGGAKPSDKTQAGSLSLDTMGKLDVGGLTGKKFSQENSDFRDFALNYAAEIGMLVKEETGAALKDLITVRIGGRDGLRLRVGGTSEEQSFDTAGELIKEMTHQIIALGGNASLASEKLMNVDTAISHIDFTDTEQAFSDLQFALSFDTLGDTVEQASAMKQEFDALNAAFAEASTTANRLGLAEERVTQARDKALDNLRDQFNTSLEDSIFGVALPTYADFLALGKQYKQAMDDALLIGGDTQLVQLAYQQQLNALLAQSNDIQTEKLNSEIKAARDLANRFAKIGSTFDDLLYQLNYGQFTALDPVTNLNQLRELVTTTGRDAQLGNADAAEKLAQILPDFLKLSEEVNGSNALYAADQRMATSLAQSTRDVAYRQLDVQTRIATATESTLAAIQRTGSVRDERFFTGDFSGTTYDAANGNVGLQRGVAAGILSTAQADALALATGFYGLAGGNRRSQFYEENPINNAALVAALRAAGVPGYASGGRVWGGAEGRDATPSLLMRDEHVIRATAARSIGHANLAYMNSTGQLPANDNSEELLVEVKTLTRLLAAVGDRLAALQERTAVATENVAAERVVQAWK